MAVRASITAPAPPPSHLTPQVPQFLLEAGYGCARFPERGGTIGVTQPRRVAAISTATRVADELGESIGETVGYQVGGGCLRGLASDIGRLAKLPSRGSTGSGQSGLGYGPLWFW